VAIRVDHPQALVDVLLHITVTGLEPRERVSVQADTTDATGMDFRSAASFTAGDEGEIDLARDAPSSGSYSGVDPMGLFWSMAPVDGAPSYVDLLQPEGQPVTLTVTDQGQTLARRTVLRRPVSPGVTVRQLRPAQVGFYGAYHSAADVSSPGPAVLLFGGSEGGLHGQATASLLASYGYPTLDLAYFKEPGLPHMLSRIPLEYFTRALGWLSRQPGVDPRRLVVSGASRGSEAALLLGARFPSLVHGVVALVPGDVVLCGFPCSAGPAWTLGGKPLPYVQFPGPGAPGHPAAVIPVERIRGPVFLACGGHDDVWPSCPMAHAMVHRLQARNHPYRDVLVDYPKAGHGVGLLVPYDPDQLSGLEGATPDANARAREAAWPKLLDFLARVGGG